MLDTNLHCLNHVGARFLIANPPSAADIDTDAIGSHEIRVEGYTDTDKLVKTKDKWKTNERLSAYRALAVEEYLVAKGVNNDRIYSAAFGPSNPKGSKQASRRVEIVILGQ